MEKENNDESEFNPPACESTGVSTDHLYEICLDI